MKYKNYTYEAKGGSYYLHTPDGKVQKLKHELSRLAFHVYVDKLEKTPIKEMTIDQMTKRFFLKGYAVKMQFNPKVVTVKDMATREKRTFPSLHEAFISYFK